MTCDEARPAIDALVDGELPREEERLLRGHLDGCAACAREMTDRAAFSGTLREAFDRGLEAAEPPPGARERLAERLHARSRGRIGVPARLAAALVFGVAVGLAAWAVGLSRPTTQQAELAAKLQERRVSEEKVSRLVKEIEQDVRIAVEPGPPAELRDVIGDGARLIEAQLALPAEKALPQLVADTGSPEPGVRSAARAALKRLEPARLEELRRASKDPAGDGRFVQQVIEELEDRTQPVERGTVSISKTVNGATVAFTQLRDGRVRLVVPGGSYEERSMSELLRLHPEVCRQFGVSGRDGAVVVDGTPAALNLRGQLDLVFRTGAWTDDVQWEATRAWMSGKLPDPAQVEARVRELQERCRRQYASMPELRVEMPADVDQIMKDVRAMTRRQMEEARQQVDREMKALDERLQSLHELRVRARGLRVWAEDVKKEK